VKGIIFNLVEDAVCVRYGEPVWDHLLSEAGLAGGYTSMGDYPHIELHALVGAAAETIGASRADVLRVIGQDAVTGLARHYPHFFEPHERAADLVVTLNDVIHPEVRKLHDAANPPEFVFTTDGDDLLVEYHSHRGLCALADGMIVGTAEHFGERAEVAHDRCTAEGDAACLLRCRFTPTPGEAGPGGR
jgi:hypothetical protein